MMQHAYDLNQWALPAPGDTIAGKYVVEGPCGRGRLAMVLSAVHAGLDRRVALKVLLPEWAHDPEVVQRFIRQGLAARRIKSEHALRVLDLGMLTDAAPYLVIEFQEGRPLDDILAAGALPLQTAVDWVLQAAEALAEAHAYGIIHRDIKPANLLLTHRSHGSAWIQVSDFGLPNVVRINDTSWWKAARPTDTRQWPHCMAPEQLRGSRDVGEAADLWSLGATLFELITAKAPFRAHSLPALCTAILTQSPGRVSSYRANVPAGLERVIRRCLEKDPEARFGSVAEFARAVAPFGSAAATGSSERIQRFADGPAPELTPPVAPTAFDEASIRDSSSDYADALRRRLGGPVSAKMIFGSLAFMAALGAGAFAAMYEGVHRGDSAAAQWKAEAPLAPAPVVPLFVVPAPTLEPPKSDTTEAQRVVAPAPSDSPIASAAPVVVAAPPQASPRVRAVHTARTLAPVRSSTPRAEAPSPASSDEIQTAPAASVPDKATPAPANSAGSAVNPAPAPSDPAGSAAFDSRE